SASRRRRADERRPPAPTARFLRGRAVAVRAAVARPTAGGAVDRAGDRPAEASTVGAGLERCRAPPGRGLSPDRSSPGQQRGERPESGAASNADPEHVTIVLAIAFVRSLVGGASAAW